MKYLAILGRQPELGLAELEAQLGPDALLPFGSEACELSSPIELDRFGGVVRTAQILQRDDVANWEQTLRKAVDAEAEQWSDGKLSIGFSFFGVRINPKQIQKLGLSHKKRLKRSGLSVRYVPSKAEELNAAQVLRNKLDKDGGLEFLIVSNGTQVIIAKTTNIQDIDAYAKRDREKPHRDPENGMLPPKLAQILINLSGKQNGHLLDPFCGSGTLIMEAVLMGFDVTGADISKQKVEESVENLAWMSDAWNVEAQVAAMQADARDIQLENTPDVVAAETYLGPPLSSFPDQSKLENITHDVDEMLRQVLQNFAQQLPADTPVVLAVPVWLKHSGSKIHLPLVDDLENLGYNRARFKHISEPLVYYRSDQVVGREILVLKRK